MTVISRRWPGIHRGFPQRHIPGWNGRYGSWEWHWCPTWKRWTGTCPLAPLKGHVDAENERRRGQGQAEWKGPNDFDPDYEGNQPKQLRYREPTRARIEQFTRAAIAAAASVAAHQVGSAKSPEKAGAVGWQEPWDSYPVPKQTGPGDLVTKGLLALALAGALTGAHELLRGRSRLPSSALANQLETRLSRGLQRQLGTPTSRVGGMAFRFNWAANLRALQGGSIK